MENIDSLVKNLLRDCQQRRVANKREVRKIKNLAKIAISCKKIVRRRSRWESKQHFRNERQIKRSSFSLREAEAISNLLQGTRFNERSFEFDVLHDDNDDTGGTILRRVYIYDHPQLSTHREFTLLVVFPNPIYLHYWWKSIDRSIVRSVYMHKAHIAAQGA